MKRVVVVAWLMVLCFPAVARGADPEDLANRISAEVMSPYCPGVTLHDCPSDAAVQLRDRILGWAEAGWTHERILDRLEAEYGASILSTPPASGIGLGAWVMPLVVALGGLALAWAIATRWSRRRSDETAPVPTAAQRSRLEAELAHARDEL
jgi:cytochrome c-type biogenesis protein CcmH/NrfF